MRECKHANRCAAERAARASTGGCSWTDAVLRIHGTEPTRRRLLTPRARIHWNKAGLVLPAPGAAHWAHTHAALPVARLTDGDRLELLFSGRDAAGRSHIGRAIASWRGDSVALDSVELEPLLSPGTLGVFDDSGVTVSSLVENEGLQLLYYTGWSLGRTVPFYLCAGLAVSEDGGLTFHRHSVAPLLERTSVDPLLTASPFVMNDDGVWRMWYISGVDWHLRDGQPEHRYHIKYAESSDGFSWRRDGTVSVDLEGTECALGRPWVIRRGNRYLMWFSSRGDSYRLGYAESTDGVHWQRCDSAVGIAPDPAGWDSAMTYPCVLTEGTRWLLLYNGSGYGETGIGYAHGREEPA